MNSGNSQQLPVAVVGFGGHGRVCVSALLAAGHRVVAATELHPEDCAGDALGIPVITDEQLGEQYHPDEIRLVLGIGSIWPVSSTSQRARTVERLVQRGYRFVGFQHPSAWVSPDTKIASTAQIHAGVIVQSATVVGDFAILNTGCTVDHDCWVGDYCHLGPGVTISGDVRVGSGSHLGTGANVIQGLSLGKRCFVAAGATVVADLLDDEFVRGIPAKSFPPPVDVG